MQTVWGKTAFRGGFLPGLRHGGEVKPQRLRHRTVLRCRRGNLEQAAAESAKKPQSLQSGPVVFDGIEAVVGAIFIVAGLSFFAASGISVDSASFGADFYTYTYGGIQAAVRLLGILARILSVLMV